MGDAVTDAITSAFLATKVAAAPAVAAAQGYLTLKDRVQDCLSNPWKLGSSQCKSDLAIWDQMGKAGKAAEERDRAIRLRDAAEQAMGLRTSASQAKTDASIAVAAAKAAGYDVKKDGSVVRSTSSGLTYDPNAPGGAMQTGFLGMLNNLPLVAKLALVGGVGYVGYSFLKEKRS